MKTLDNVECGQIIQSRNWGATGIVLEKIPNQKAYQCYLMGIGHTNIDAPDICAVGPQLGTIKLTTVKILG